MASGGMARLRLRGTVRTWRTVADSPTESRDAPTSSALEEALGADDGLVIVTGSSLAATTAITDRALRRMLGDHALVVVVRPHHVLLAELLTLARSVAPVVVRVLDAPPALLASITPEMRTMVDDQVRLVVTTRPSFLDAVADDEATAVLASATVRLDGSDDAGPDVAGRLTSLRRTARVVALAVADLAGLGLPVSPSWVVAVLALHEPPIDRPVPPRGQSGRGRWELHVRRAVDTTIRAGLVRRHRGSLAPTPALVDHAADPAAGRPVKEVTAHLRAVVTARELRTAGLVSLAQGDVDRAIDLLKEADPLEVPRAAAAELGETASRRKDHDEAIRWYLSVESRGDDALARRARRTVALADQRASGGKQYGAWLAVAGEDESDTEVQEVLARRALGQGDRVEARHRFELAARGSGKEAVEAVYELAMMAAEDGRDDDAEPLLRRAGDDPVRLHAVRARLVLIRALRRHGRRVDALEVAEAAARWLQTDDPPAWHAAVARELAALRRDGGDLEGAAAVLRPFVRRRFAQALAACADLAEVEAERLDWKAARDAFPERMPTVVDGSSGFGERMGTHATAVFHGTDPVIDVPNLDIDVARGFLVLAKIAYSSKQFREGMRFVEEVVRRITPSAEVSRLFGEIAIGAGDLYAARTHLTRAAGSADVALGIVVALRLQAVEAGLTQFEAQRAAQVAAEPFHA